VIEDCIELADHILTLTEYVPKLAFESLIDFVWSNEF